MDAIVLAAGRSVRMGAGKEKQLMRIGGKPMFIFAVERLLEHPSVDRIILTAREDRLDHIQAVLNSYQLSRAVLVIPGGQTRQESVSCGLQRVTTERVMVHEAARPVISQALLSRVVAPDDDAVVPVVEIPFTVAVGGDVMEEMVERSSLRNVQLPQVFRTETLRKAHELAKKDEFMSTEDSQLVFRMGVPVRFVEGAVENIKVTYPVDFVVAHEWIFGEEES